MGSYRCYVRSRKQSTNLQGPYLDVTALHPPAPPADNFLLLLLLVEKGRPHELLPEASW